MSDDQGFRVDLENLSMLADQNIPFIERTCRYVNNIVETVSEPDWDLTIFETMNSTLYSDAMNSFAASRSSVYTLLDTLSSSLEQCAVALREIHRRYWNADMHNAATISQTGSTS